MSHDTVCIHLRGHLFGPATKEMINPVSVYLHEHLFGPTTGRAGPVTTHPSVGAVTPRWVPYI